jgi:2-polyprenyl-3-methyl-5-hydroxy-6-metoxy-1,4-benzoquinol methylase
MNFAFICIYVLFFVINTAYCTKDQFYHISKEQWEKEYAKGEWNYLDRQAIERARAGVIINMFYDMYGGGAFGPIASTLTSSAGIQSEQHVQHLLDVGCGPGTLTDYLRGPQRKFYEGIDLSTQAIETARKLRADSGSPNSKIHAGIRPLQTEQFQQADCMSWMPPLEKDGRPRQYGTIVFNEMLYYVDHKKVLERYQKFLRPGGIIVISVWFNKEKSLRDTIFSDARKMLQSVDEVEFAGVTYTGTKRTKMPVSFHVEAFRVNA